MLGERTIREALDLNNKAAVASSLIKPVTEEELIAKSTAPRVTDADVEAFIAEEQYFTANDGVVGASSYFNPKECSPVLELLTICVLVLKNGFTVHGTSACADKANFDPEIGRRIARANAKSHIWAHLGFELRTKLNLVENAPAPTVPGMTTHVGTKVVHAAPMTRGDYNFFRGWPVPADENPNDDGYLVEYADGGEPNVPGFFGYVSWSPKDVFDRAYGEPLKAV